VGEAVVRRSLQHLLELDPGTGIVAAVQQRAAQRHAGRGVRRVSFEAFATDLDRLLELTLLPHLLGELREQA
jgi:hypothetical protein